MDCIYIPPPPPLPLPPPPSSPPPPPPPPPSVSFRNLRRFWLSQPRHAKPSYSAPVLSNYPHPSPSNRYTHHPAIFFLVFLFVGSPLATIIIFFFIIVEESILCMWPNYMILWALINLTMSVPLIKRIKLKNFEFCTYFPRFVVGQVSFLRYAFQINEVYFYHVRWQSILIPPLG